MRGGEGGGGLSVQYSTVLYVQLNSNCKYGYMILYVVRTSSYYTREYGIQPAPHTVHLNIPNPIVIRVFIRYRTICMSFSLKKGWHPPGRDGKKESFRNDFKGINQVAGWMGKGKDPKAEERETHVSQPLSSLKDRESSAVRSIPFQATSV